MRTLPMYSLLKRQLLAATLVVGMTFSMSAPSAFAADSNVRLAGQVVISNLMSAGSMTGEARASAIQQNLDNALVATGSVTPQSVDIKYVKGMPVLTLGGYHVATVDSASAKAASTTPALLAMRWADTLRSAVGNSESTRAYISQLSGGYAQSAPNVIASQPPQQTTYNQQRYEYQEPASQQNPTFQTQYQPQTGAYTPQMPNAGQDNLVFAPAGLVIPAELATPITSQVAQPGDVIQAKVSQAVILGNAQIPVGSVLQGQIESAKAGSFLGRTGALSLRFTSLRTPDGQNVPLSASLMGDLGKYEGSENGSVSSFKGETWKGKVVQAGLRGAIGAGTGAALGTAVGAIAGGKRGVARGAWSGTAIGAGTGVAQSILLRKGKDVVVKSGTPIKLQLDSALRLAASGSTLLGPTAYSGNF